MFIGARFGPLVRSTGWAVDPRGPLEFPAILVSVPELYRGPNASVAMSEDGLFEVRVWQVGEEQDVDAQSRPDVAAILDEIQVHLEANAPVYYSVGLKGLSDLSLSERWTIASRMRENRRFIRRSALFGLTTQLEFAFRVIVRVSGRTDLKVCRTEEEARAWLLAEKEAFEVS